MMVEKGNDSIPRFLSSNGGVDGYAREYLPNY